MRKIKTQGIGFHASSEKKNYEYGVTLHEIQVKLL